MSRSWSLVSGEWWHAFGVMIVPRSSWAWLGSIGAIGGSNGSCTGSSSPIGR